MWSAAALIFLFYFLFQVHYPHQGYHPFQATAYVTYAYRTMLCGALFFGLCLWFMPSPIRDKALCIALGVLIAAAIAYFGIVVAGRPDLTALNDRSEALSRSLELLFAGVFPYYAETQLGNPVSALSTSLLLAIPAANVFDRPELMTLPILGFAFAILLLHRRVSGSTFPVPLLAVLLFLNPVVIHEIAIGSDLMWGSALLVAATLCLSRGKLGLASILFGLSLCTRVSFMMLVPLRLIATFRWHHRRALLPALLCLGCVLALELPLLLWNPAHFLHHAPLGMSLHKLVWAFPIGDNAISDALGGLLPEGTGRAWLISVTLLLFSGALGLAVRNTVDLSIATAAVFGISLFTLGSFFFVDYLIWMVFPPLQVLCDNPSQHHRHHSGAAVSESSHSSTPNVCG